MVSAVYLMAILFGCPSAMVVLLCLMLKRVGNYDTGACSAVHQVAFGLARGNHGVVCLDAKHIGSSCRRPYSAPTGRRFNAVLPHVCQVMSTLDIDYLLGQPS